CRPTPRPAPPIGGSGASRLRSPRFSVSVRWARRASPRCAVSYACPERDGDGAGPLRSLAGTLRCRDDRALARRLRLVRCEQLSDASRPVEHYRRDRRRDRRPPAARGGGPATRPPPSGETPPPPGPPPMPPPPA